MATGAQSNVSSSREDVFRQTMALDVLRQTRQALTTQNPRELRETAERPIKVGLIAPSAEALGQIESYLLPMHFSPERRAQAAKMLVRGGGEECDIEIYDSSIHRPAKAFSLDLESPENCVRRILKSREDLMLPLARRLYPFRKPAVHRLIRSIAKENALFCLTTAIPDVIPSLAMIPWAAGEFASDTA